MDMELIYKNVKEAFCSLWKFKIRGNSLEIITPISTTTSKFISVFITRRKEEFIVTDGGWLASGEYDTIMDLDDDAFQKIFSHYQNYYNIKVGELNSYPIYFKSTLKQDLIPNLVYDITHFLSVIISTSQIQFQDIKEKEEKESFRKVADNFIAGIVNRNNLKFGKELGENYKNVRFNAVISSGSRITLVKYITGSTHNYLMGSLTKAIVDFEIANGSEYNTIIKNRVALINDTAPGYDSRKVFRYVQTLEDHTQQGSFIWSNRDSVIDFLN